MVQYISRNFRGNFRDPKLFYMYQRLISKLMIELEKSFHTGPACRPLCRLLPPPIGHVGWWSRHAAPRRPPYPRSERSRCLTPDWPPTNRSEAAVDRSPEPPPCPCRSRRQRSAELWGALTSIISVLEDYKGFAAMHKSRDLIRGKLPTAVQSAVTTSRVIIDLQAAGSDVVRLSGVTTREPPLRTNRATRAPEPLSLHHGSRSCPEL
jgi:hypothetical protein